MKKYYEMEGFGGGINWEKLAKERGKEIERLKGLDDPFTLKNVLAFLAKATDYLLRVKDYDGPDYEELEICVRRAKEIIKINNL